MIKKTLIVISLLLSTLLLELIFLGFFITGDIAKKDVILGVEEIWFDDWFTLTSVDKQTIAIGEPRYWQRNYNYLLLGNKRAILFDTGPGVRNIKPVVDSLTQLPVTVISSHPHYDHIGNNYRFEHIAWLDIEAIRSEVEDNIFQPSILRGFTSRRIPAFAISEWWRAEQEIDLGDRKITAFHIPGHESGSVALLDSARQQLFTGDFIYPGWLVAFAPTSNLSDYVSSVRYLLAHTSGNEKLFGAHSVPEHPSPALPHSALIDLEKALVSINSDTLEPVSHFPIRIYPVNKDMEIYLPPF